MSDIPRSAYARLADRLSDVAERNAEVSVYISADDVAGALGDKGHDADVGLVTLRAWLVRRRSLGFAPTVEDIFDWIDEALE